MKNYKALLQSTLLLWGVLTIVFLLCLVLSWFVTDHILASHINALIQEKTAAIEQQAANIAEGIASDLSDLHGIPTLVARDGGVLSALSRFGADVRPSPLAVELRKKTWSEDASLKAVGDYLSLVSTTMGEDVAFIMNAAGDCVAASNADKPESFVGTNYANREYFREAIDGKKGYQYAMGKKTNIPGLFFSAPVIHEGRIMGVVAVKINITALLHNVKQADAFMTDEYGVIILASNAKLEMRALPGAAITGLSKAERMARYKREDFPVLTVNPWPGRGGALLHRFDEESQPLVLTDRTLKEKEAKVHVFRRLPEIVEMNQERLRVFLLLGISGGIVFLLVGWRIIYLRFRKQAEDKLVKSERHFRAVAQSANDAIITGAVAGNIAGWNAGAERLFGYTEAEIIGQPLTMLMPERFRNLHSEGLARVVAGGVPHVIGKTVELTGLRKDGSEFPLDISLAQWQAADGQFFTAIIRDVTERKQAENALHQARCDAEIASLAKSEFLANMSHEIRTPMNAILGMAEILSETELSPEQRKYVGIFQNAGDTLLELINDILDLSKVEAGQMELDKQDFSLEQTLNELIDLHAMRAFDKGVELVLDLNLNHGTPEFVHSDAKRLKQCLTNLVGNAIKFSHEGTIVIGVRPVDGCPDMLQFSVLDTGIGIPAEKQESIFEAFSQADSSTTRRFGGTGLGLTITRRLVGLMAGKIWVDSQEGKGSTFYFTARLPQAAQPMRTGAPVDLRNLKVLVVDDFSINRIIVRQYLQPLGAQVFEAESAKQALALLEEAAVNGKPFALALVDSQMPEMGGLDLSALIRANTALKELKITMLSSDDTTKNRQRAKDLALTYLLKPIKRHELIQSIGHELQRITPKAQKAETLPSAPQATQGGLHILLAEDNQDNVMLIHVFLKQTTHRLDVAEDGLIALEKFRANRYDVVLMDIQMPKMGGYEATAEIRRIEQEEDRTPTMIIALTAHALKEDEQRSIDAGCNGHLTKPIKKKVLLEVLQSIHQPKPSE